MSVYEMISLYGDVQRILQSKLEGRARPAGLAVRPALGGGCVECVGSAGRDHYSYLVPWIAIFCACSAMHDAIIIIMV